MFSGESNDVRHARQQALHREIWQSARDATSTPDGKVGVVRWQGMCKGNLPHQLETENTFPPEESARASRSQGLAESDAPDNEEKERLLQCIVETWKWR